MLFLLLIFVLTGMALTMIIWIVTIFLQGYYYTEPTQGIVWQAPAAGFALGLFLTLWAMLIVNARVTDVADLPYDTIFRFSPRVDKYKDPVKELWVMRKGSKEPAAYRLKKKWDGVKAVNEYVEAQSGRAYTPSGVEKIILKEDGDKVTYELQPVTQGTGYREFRNDDGWTVREYAQSGPTGLPEAFRWSRFLMNMFLNFFHFLLWFVCFWLVVRFQWGHALGLAIVMWLIMTLAVLPMVFEQAARQGAPGSLREKAGNDRARPTRLVHQFAETQKAEGRDGMMHDGCFCS